MSGYDPQLLYMMGIEETQFDFPLPIYVRYQMSQYQEGMLTVYHSQPRPLSSLALIRLILQISDMPKFLR